MNVTATHPDEEEVLWANYPSPNIWNWPNLLAKIVVWYGTVEMGGLMYGS